MNWELPDVQAGFRKGRGTRDQIANICWITEKAREFQKNIYYCIINYTKAFDCVDHNKLWEILKEMGIPDHLTCLLRNLSAGQEATDRTGHGTTDWFQIGKGVCQSCILSSCLFNLYAGFSSILFSNSVMSNSLQPHELQHARLPCPSPTPRAYSKVMSIESVMDSVMMQLVMMYPIISSSVSSSPAFSLSQHQIHHVKC